MANLIHLAKWQTLRRKGGSFKTVERPYVSNTFPADGSQGQLLNLNPRITFSLPTKNFIENTTSYYELYKNDLEKMVNLNKDYSIINPTNNTPTIIKPQMPNGR